MIIVNEDEALNPEIRQRLNDVRADAAEADNANTLRFDGTLTLLAERQYLSRKSTTIHVSLVSASCLARASPKTNCRVAREFGAHPRL
jgi:hypothetical protein